MQERLRPDFAHGSVRDFDNTRPPSVGCQPSAGGGVLTNRVAAIRKPYSVKSIWAVFEENRSRFQADARGMRTSRISEARVRLEASGRFGSCARFFGENS